MTLARVLREFLESPLPHNRENDIAEKNKFVDAINEELQRIEDFFLKPHDKNFNQFLDIQIEYLRCDQLIHLISSYLRTKSADPEYKAIEVKLDKVNEKLLAVQKLFLPHPRKSGITPASTNAEANAFAKL